MDVRKVNGTGSGGKKSDIKTRRRFRTLSLDSLFEALGITQVEKEKELGVEEMFERLTDLAKKMSEEFREELLEEYKELFKKLVKKVVSEKFGGKANMKTYRAEMKFEEAYEKIISGKVRGVEIIRTLEEIKGMLVDLYS